MFSRGTWFSIVALVAFGCFAPCAARVEAGHGPGARPVGGARGGFLERLMGFFRPRPTLAMSRREVIDLDFRDLRPSAEWLLRFRATPRDLLAILYSRTGFVLVHETDALARGSAAWVRDVLARMGFRTPVVLPPIPPAPTPTVTPPTPPPTVPPVPTPTTPPPAPTEPPTPTQPPVPTEPPTLPPAPTDPPPPDPEPPTTPPPTPPPGHVVIKAGNAMGSQLVHQLMGHAQPVMPPAPKPLLSEADQKVIQQWIDAGCTEADFNANAKPIFDRSCNSCHAPGVAAGGISFKTYELISRHIQFP